jgi:hypothetical protein
LPRTRTTKTVAQRIDLNYFKRSTPFKRARLTMVILIPLLAIAWIAATLAIPASIPADA